MAGEGPDIHDFAVAGKRKPWMPTFVGIHRVLNAEGSASKAL